MHRQRLLFAPIVLLSFAACAVVACSSKSSGGGVPNTTPTSSGGSQGSGTGDDAANNTGGACDLASDGLTFASADCDTCMQQNCCEQTVTCVKTDADCAALQACILACPVPGAGGGKDGGGGGGGGGDGGHDGGKSGGDGGTAAACRDACNAKYPAAQADQKAYNECITGPCGPACLGTAPTDGGHDTGSDAKPHDAAKG